ncbi:hypothetical protein SVIOM74S_04802 [Streptomyces violarus]
MADVRTCDNLSQAAKDLRKAAKQRTGLVDQPLHSCRSTSCRGTPS